MKPPRGSFKVTKKKNRPPDTQTSDCRCITTVPTTPFGNPFVAGKQARQRLAIASNSGDRREIHKRSYQEWAGQRSKRASQKARRGRKSPQHNNQKAAITSKPLHQAPRICLPLILLNPPSQAVSTTHHLRHAPQCRQLFQGKPSKSSKFERVKGSETLQVRTQQGPTPQSPCPALGSARRAVPSSKPPPMPRRSSWPAMSPPPHCSRPTPPSSWNTSGHNWQLCSTAAITQQTIPR